MNANLKIAILSSHYVKGKGITIIDIKLKKTPVKNSDIIIDSKLIFNEHINKICDKTSQKLKAINARVLPFMRKEEKKQFSYCPLVWMLHSKTFSNRINRTRRVIFMELTSL